MSVVTYYGRLTQTELDALCTQADGREQFMAEGNPKVLYLDQASEVIAWLLSPLKRHEQLQFADVLSAGLEFDSFDSFVKRDHEPEFQLDEILVPVEGRGERTEPRLDTGTGAPCVINPDEVKRYAEMLALVDEAQLRSRLDFRAMDKACLSVGYWQEQGEETFSEIILPLFEQLKVFYQDAASNGEHLLILHS